RARAFEGSGAGRKCGAGRHDVVYQNHGESRYLDGWRDGEGSANVAPTLGARKAGLGPGVTDLLEALRLKPQRTFSPTECHNQSAGQGFGLIVSALALPAPMQWDRHHQKPARSKNFLVRSPRLGEQPAEPHSPALAPPERSEERRVGKACRRQWWAQQ